MKEYTPGVGVIERTIRSIKACSASYRRRRGTWYSIGTSFSLIGKSEATKRVTAACVGNGMSCRVVVLGWTVVAKPTCALAYRPLDLGYVIDNFAVMLE